VSFDVQNRPASDESSGGISLGTILFGLILLFIGLLWLLDVADVLSVTWTLVGSIILVVIGVLLIFGARTGAHGGMIFLGIVLSVIVLLGSLANWPSFQGGVGDRSVAPATFEEVEERYSWALGNHYVDLSEIEFPEGETEVTVQLGTGEMLVTLPEDIAYKIDWSVGVGDAQILDTNRSGVGLAGDLESDDYDGADRRLVLTLRLGIGSMEVTE
jgi:hypothetical protein